MHCLGSTCHFLRILIPFEEPPHLTADLCEHEGFNFGIRNSFLSHARALLSAVRGLVMSSVAGEVSCHREGKWGRLA